MFFFLKISIGIPLVYLWTLKNFPLFSKKCIFIAFYDSRVNINKQGNKLPIDTLTPFSFFPSTPSSLTFFTFLFQDDLKFFPVFQFIQKWEKNLPLPWCLWCQECSNLWNRSYNTLWKKDQQFVVNNELVLWEENSVLCRVVKKVPQTNLNFWVFKHKYCSSSWHPVKQTLSISNPLSVFKITL